MACGITCAGTDANFPFFLNHYCTYFDHRYAEQGLAMISSLIRFEKKAVVWVLALTEECEALLQRVALPAIAVVPLRVLLKESPDLEKVRNRRSVVEFYFTANPVFVRFCLEKVPKNQLLTIALGSLPLMSTVALVTCVFFNVVAMRAPPFGAIRNGAQGRHGHVDFTEVFAGRLPAPALLVPATQGGNFGLFSGPRC
jgi:hypothetical protein